MAGSPEIVPLGIGMEDVKGGSRLHEFMHILKRIAQEIPELAVFASVKLKKFEKKSLTDYDFTKKM